MNAIKLFPLLFVASLSATGVNMLFSKPLYLGAHRGGADLWPENTVYAYQQCIAQWPDILLEADVYETADGHIVVSHDATVDRTTDGSGRISEMTLAQLKALDAGYDFTPDGGQTFPHRGKGLTIPTLEEALKAVPEGRWLVETKDGANVAQKTVAIIKGLGMEDRVLLASFKPAHMTYARENAPEIARCYDFGTAVRLLSALEGDWDAYEPDAKVLSLSRGMIAQYEITPEMIAKVKTKGILTQIHTINRTEDMIAMLEFGFDSILSDRPDLLHQAITDYLKK